MSSGAHLLSVTKYETKLPARNYIGSIGSLAPSTTVTCLTCFPVAVLTALAHSYDRVLIAPAHYLPLFLTLVAIL